MSLILDALDKADQERKRNSEENINPLYNNAGTAPKHSSEIKKRYIVAIALVLAVLLIAVYVIGRSSAYKRPEVNQTATGKLDKLASDTNNTQTPANNQPRVVAAPSTPRGDTLLSKQEALQKQLIAAQYEQARKATEQQQATKLKPQSGDVGNGNNPRNNQKNQNKSPSSDKQSISDIYNSNTQATSTASKPIAKPIPTAKQPSMAATPNSALKEVEKFSLSDAQAIVQQALIEKAVVEKAKSEKALAEQTKVQQAKKPSENQTAASAQTARPNTIKPAEDSLQQFPELATIGDLPGSVQQAIPSIFYSEHNYKRNGRGNVKLNNNSKRKGAQAVPGVYIEKILVDGIILRHKNYTFKMPALNSWVNM